MNQKQRAEALYTRIREAGVVTGLEIVSPEDFLPLPGTILVTLPPIQTVTKGGIELPDSAQKPPLIACVLSVPDDATCPVQPGDWVFYRAGHLQELPLADHENLGYLQYADDATSELLGFVPEERMNAIMADLAVQEDRWKDKIQPTDNPRSVTETVEENEPEGVLVE